MDGRCPRGVYFVVRRVSGPGTRRYRNRSEIGYRTIGSVCGGLVKWKRIYYG